MSKRVAVLGSTGSIGRQSLEVIREQGYEVAALSAGRNAALLLEQAREFCPPILAVADEEAAAEVQKELDALERPPFLFVGKDAARNAVAEAEADIVLNAIVGIAGLDATLTALADGTTVALANKESLVAGGQLVMREMQARGGVLLPVDSEHSAIFQCLQDPNSARTLQKIILTASGGPFYGKTQKDLAKIGPAEALRHPNWSMGQKITIDSATLMNKGLELIEAMWLFDLPPRQIEIVVQRQSVIHSMVEFSDHSVLAQLGVPDMRIPIQYALTWPQRRPGPAPALDFRQLRQLDFGPPDEETFRCLAACRKAAEKGGLAPCAANGANEEAVALFLEGRLSFLDIGRLVEGCVDGGSYAGAYTLEDVYACDAAARRYVREHI
ncbi:1-deoxy-D-xylulose-5-phosphate reductoisomerase [Ruminococcaceae bacterium OttesenSCG-928-I18]|nr:1-deoxy-D-xylulose-5-phosphate reductoisomerase [Ruminococcaceae bacterium OttesenSCG-928-I18]